MIRKFEGEVFRLQRELHQSRIETQHEMNLRQQLEDDLRRMFLKNMTSMSIEAFKIFQLQQASEPVTESNHPLDEVKMLNNVSSHDNDMKRPEKSFNQTVKSDDHDSFPVIDFGKIAEGSSTFTRSKVIRHGVSPSSSSMKLRVSSKPLDSTHTSEISIIGI